MSSVAETFAERVGGAARLIELAPLLTDPGSGPYRGDIRETGLFTDPAKAHEKLHGRGDRLPAEHHGATFRVGGSGSTSPR
ncbi:MAG: hypothetical protein ABUL47_03490 [Leifsonia sp.]